MIICKHCGSELSDIAYKCPNCGTYVKNSKIKKKSITIILCLLGGMLGLHNIYLEKYTKGLIQLLLTMMGMIYSIYFVYLTFTWMIIDISLLVSDKVKDGKGNELI